MEEQYRKEITWWFAEFGSESEVDNRDSYNCINN